MRDTETQTAETGAPTDVTGGMPATDSVGGRTDTDPLVRLDPSARQTLAAIAGHLIPTAHGMPSAADVVDDERLRFVLRSRPDLVEPLANALRPELSTDIELRLDALAKNEPATLAALQLTIVAGYYTDRRVRELIGYPGQMAIEVRSWEYPPYLEEGLIDAVMARGPVWRDPRTGERAIATGAPRTYAERTWSEAAHAPGGGHDGRDQA